MFTAINRIRVRPGQGESLVRRFGKESGIDQAAGFRGVRFLGRIWSRIRDEKIEFLSISEWESEHDFEAWTEGDVFRRAEDGLGVEFLTQGDPAGVRIGQ